MAPRPSRNPLLAIIVVLVLAVIVVAAVVNHKGTTHTPSGQLVAPQAQPASPAIMPQQSTVPNEQQPASTEPGATGHHGTANEPGGPARTGSAVGGPG